MAKQPEKTRYAQPQAGHGELRLELKDRGFAAFLTWLIPGAGQWYQGRRGKAGLFFVCVMGTFLYGLLLGEGRVVYAQWNPSQFRRYPYLCQVGVGLPSLPALVGNIRQDKGNESLPFTDKRWYMPPKIVREQDQFGDTVVKSIELDQLNLDLNRRFELGTVFTMIAGLLNVLVIYDAWSGPAYGLARREDKEEDHKADDDAESAKETKAGQHDAANEKRIESDEQMPAEQAT